MAILDRFFNLLDFLLDFPNRVKVKVRFDHEFSEPVDIGGEEYDRGPFHFTVAKRRIRICVHCGITDAIKDFKPWCKPRKAA
jgi:hypothetical protein